MTETWSAPEQLVGKLTGFEAGLATPWERPVAFGVVHADAYPILNEAYARQIAADWNVTAQDGLTSCTPPDGTLLILDWQHASYRLRPHMEPTGMSLPHALQVPFRRELSRPGRRRITDLLGSSLRRGGRPTTAG